MSARRFVVFFMLAAGLFVAVYQPQQPVVLDLSAPGSEKFLDNWFGPEREARWTQAHSAVWLSGLGGGNLAWRVGVRLSGPRPSGIAAPRVRVRANGATLAEFSAPNELRDYEWELAPWQLGANGDLLLELESDTFTPSSDPRPLGVRVARVWLTRADGFAVPSLKDFALLLVLAAVVATATRALPLSLALWLAGCAALALGRAEAAWWLAPLSLGALFAGALASVIARIVSVGGLTRRQTLGLCTLFGAAAVLRLALDVGRGYEGDVAIYMSLAWKTVHFGIASAYMNVSEVPPPNTPPGLLYPFWLLGWLYNQLFAPLFAPTWLNDPDILRFMLRLPALSADLLTGALIFRALSREPFGFRLCALATAAYLFNPALIFDSAYWGQTAALHTLCMLLALLAAERRAYGWSGAALAAAVLTKPQALAILPLVLLLAARERGLLRALGGGLAGAALLCAPFIASGSVDGVIAQYTRTADFHPYVSVNAHNLWWFVSGGQGWQPDTLPLGPLSARTVGLSLFAGATLLSVATLWRDRRALFAAAAYQSLAFFMLNTQIHENHMLPMFAPLVLAAVADRRAWWLYGAFSLTALANMALHDPNLVMRLGYPAEEIYGGPGLALPRWLNAAAQTGLFAAFTLRLGMHHVAWTARSKPPVLNSSNFNS